MADHKDRLADYIEVPDRIRQFKEAHPDGSLQAAEWTPEFRQMGEQTFIVYTALAYRTPDDPRPGVGMAWEPFPGKTPYTKDSELMNAETSAWGRALAALGFVGKKGKAKVATKEEVAARQGNGKVETIGEDPARTLMDAARQAGARSKDLSIWLTAKGVEHEPISTYGDGVAALSQLTGEQASEMSLWLDVRNAKGRDVEAKEKAA